MSTYPPATFEERLTEDGIITINAIEPLRFNANNSILSITDATQLQSGIVSTIQQQIGGVKTFTNIPKCSILPIAPEDVCNKSYVDMIASSGTSYQQPIISFIDLRTIATPTIGNRYISNITVLQFVNNYIYEFINNAWVETIPQIGYQLYVTSLNKSYVYTVNGWVYVGNTVDHNDILNRGTNSHEVIDSHISNNTNAHFGQALTTTSTPSFGGLTIGSVIINSSGIQGDLNLTGIINQTFSSPTQVNALNILNSSILDDSVACNVLIGASAATNNSFEMSYTKIATGSASNFAKFNLYGGTGSTNIYTDHEIINFTEDATSITTGGLRVTGGLGVTKSLYIGGNMVMSNGSNNISFTNTTGDLYINASGNDVFFDNTDTVRITNTQNATSTLTGSLIISGGSSIAKDLYIGGALTTLNETITSTINATNTLTGSLIINGGSSIAKDLYIGGNLTLSSGSNNISFTNTTGDLYINASGNDIYFDNTDVARFTNTTAPVSTTSGSLVISGGIGVNRIYSAEQINNYCNSKNEIVQSISSQNINTDIPKNAVFYLSGKSFVADLTGAALSPLTTPPLTVSQANGKITMGGDTVTRNLGYASNSTLDSGFVGCIRMKYTPSYDNAPNTIIYMMTLQSAGGANQLTLWHQSSGILSIQMYSSTNTLLLNRALGTWSPTAGQEYEIELNWDLVNGPIKLFIDGTQFGSNYSFTSSARSSSTGLYFITTGTDGFSFRQYTMFTSVQHTSNYVVSTPTTTLINSDGINVSSLINSTSINTGSIVASGGVGISKSLFVNNVTITSADVPIDTSFTTGSLVIAGGVGIGGKTNINGNVYVNGSISSTGIYSTSVNASTMSCTTAPVQSTDVVRLSDISNLPTISTTTFSLPYASSSPFTGSLTGVMTKYNKVVTMTIYTNHGTSVNTSMFSTNPSNPLPSGYIPAIEHEFNIVIIEGAVKHIGIVSITTYGQIFIFKNVSGTQFTAGVDVGYYTTGCSYHTE